MEKKTGKHKAWKILAGAICLQSGFIGITTNCMGVLLSATQADMGYSASQISLYYTLRGLAAALLVAPAFSFFRRKGSKRLIAAMGVMCGFGIAIMAGFSSLWMFYITAILVGAGTCICGVLIPYIIGEWFKENRGLALGIALSSSGISGAIVNPICGRFIGLWGWRITSIILGSFVCALIVISSLFLIQLPQNEEIYDHKGIDKKSYTIKGKEFIFGGILAVALVAGSNTTLANQLPIMARSYGYSNMVGATVTSIAMIGNVGGKLLMGVSCDRLGVHKSGRIFFAIVGVGLLLQCAGKYNMFLLYSGTALYGLNYALASVLLSQICIAGFGEKEFSVPMSRISAISQIGIAVVGPVIAKTYDCLGSYVPAVMVCSAFCFSSMVVLRILQNTVSCVDNEITSKALISKN